MNPPGEGVITHRERVERVLRRDADSRRADTEWLINVGPDVRREWRRRQTAIPELAEIFEVREYGQVFVADIAVN